MEPADLDATLCQVARHLYRLDPAQLEHAEQQLHRLLALLAHYRRIGQGRQGDDDASGAAHLCKTGR